MKLYLFFYSRNIQCILHHVPWNEQLIRKFMVERWDDDDGNKNYKKFTTINSTTNDEIYWEFSNVTSSATKMVKK